VSTLHTFNEYFPYSLDSNNTLITTRHGGWAILPNEEYQIFKSNNFDENSELFQKLEKAGIVLTKRSTRKIAYDLYQENKFLFTYPTYHVISITNKCNLNCIYCHPDAKPKKEEMNEETAKKVLDFIFSTPNVKGHQIVIEGGETLLRWDLVKFLYSEAKKRAKEKNLELRFSFGTNLTLMNEKIAKELSENKISPCTSLDGPRELHDKQRPYIDGRGSYENTIYWINRLKTDFKVHIYALPVITKFSLKFGPEALIDEYVKIGQDSVLFKPFRPTGRALANQSEIEMDSESFFEFWRKGIEYCISLSKKGIKIKELNTGYFINNILSSNRPSMCHRRPCGAGVSILSYNCDGTINACDAARIIGILDLGHVAKDNYQTIRAEILPLLALSPDTIPICSSCPFMAYCNPCLVCNWGQGNSLYPRPPISFECQWHKKAFKHLFEKFLNKEDVQILQSWQPRQQPHVNE